MNAEGHPRSRARRPSPLGGRRPTREELARFADADPEAIDDVLPEAGDAGSLRLLIVGINPGLWTAAVNAPSRGPGTGSGLPCTATG